VSEFTGGQTAFAGSDSPLKDEEYTAAESTCGAPAWNLPMVFGPIAIAYKLDGVDAPLTLSPEVTAKIFKGEIKKWNDPAIADLNPGVDIPDTDIVVIFRSDESGTTDNFQKYLDSAAGPEWGKGAGKTFQGGAGQGAAGNDGVAAAINGANGAITYTEWSFATAQNLSIAKVTTSASDGKGVELNAENVGKSIDTAKLKNGEGSNDLVLDTSSFYKPTDASAYPLVLATYEIVCSKYEDADTGNAVKSFLKVAASQDVQGQLEDEGYIPVPDSFRSKLETAIDAIGAGA
uniref:phosphate ABC transporter substrate-binding protein PstS n=1 Tax=Dietzia sp. TaxID=1871616 RepID=UPI002FDB7021